MGNVCCRRRDVSGRRLSWRGGGYKGRVMKVGYNGVDEVECGGTGEREGVRERWGQTYLRKRRRGDRRRNGFKRCVGIPRASLTMINGGEWHCACNDYDTHEADSVPGFGGRRACGGLQRGPPRQKGRDTRRATRQIRTSLPFFHRPTPLHPLLSLSRSLPLPSIVPKLSQHLLPSAPTQNHATDHSQIRQTRPSTDSLYPMPFSAIPAYC